MKYRLELDYALGSGALAPYLEAVKDGRALATRHMDAPGTNFPPQRVFGSGTTGGGTTRVEWVELSGKGDLLFRTDGPAGSFCLVHFDGADNRATARLLNPTATGTRVALQKADGALPGLCVRIIGDE